MAKSAKIVRSVETVHFTARNAVYVNMKQTSAAKNVDYAMIVVAHAAKDKNMLVLNVTMVLLHVMNVVNVLDLTSI